jgi:hypothetical protein
VFWNSVYCLPLVVFSLSGNPSFHSIYIKNMDVFKSLLCLAGYDTGVIYYTWIKFINLFIKSNPGSEKTATNKKNRMYTMINSQFRTLGYLLFTNRRMTTPAAKANKCTKGKSFIWLSFLTRLATILKKKLAVKKRPNFDSAFFYMPWQLQVFS